MPVVIVVGGQYGGEGKGKMTAHLCRRYGFDAAVRCGGPNSGHTITLDGRQVVLRQIPAGVVNPGTALFLAAVRMPKVISFEGCIGAGKTTLTNYFAHTLHMEKILEDFQKNPFLEEFYHGQDVALETEMAFLLIHYWQLRKDLKTSQTGYVLADFSIEKDLVYARLNLEEGALRVFENVYDYVIKQVGVPYATIYLDLSLDNLRRRIFQRGRPYEMDADVNYFKEYNDRVREYFLEHSCSTVYCLDVNDLQLDPDNAKLMEIRDRILACCT